MLEWEKLVDDDDNDYYEANSPYHIDDVPIRFRIRKKLIGNRIRWIEDHDAEIRNDETHDTLKAAKAACEMQAQNILACCE